MINSLEVPNSDYLKFKTFGIELYPVAKIYTY
jgi:hypothetical protein